MCCGVFKTMTGRIQPNDSDPQTIQTHPWIKDGWFREISDKCFPGQAFTLRVDKILESYKTAFQEILIFHNKEYGNVLVLDGIIQCTERDEFAYQEMIAHIPLYLHPDPKRVLIIGGGDGGVLREVLKHKCVNDAIMVEIDQNIISLARKYFPSMSTGLQPDPTGTNGNGFVDSRVQLNICDGFNYLKQISTGPQSGKFDIIITDSSDPEGPAEAFFHKEYFQLLRDSLIDPKNGFIISQTSENVWLNVDYLTHLIGQARSVFSNVEYCYTMVPTYTSGQLGLLICNDDKNKNLKVPVREPTELEQNQLKYYNKDIHSASFVLPKWIESKWSTQSLSSSSS